MTTLVSLAAKAHVGTKTGVVKESVEGMSESAVGCVVHSPTPAGAVVLEDLAMTVNEDRDSKMHGLEEDEGEAFDSGGVDEKKSMAEKFSLVGSGDEAKGKDVGTRRKGGEVVVADEDKAERRGILVLVADEVGE